MDHLLIQAVIYLGTTVLAVPLAARLGLGSVLGFLGAGLLIGPVLGFVGSEAEGLLDFGELGIAMMLFLVGLEVSPRMLWELRRRLLGLGGLQLVMTTGVFAAAAAALGQPWSTALAVGMILAMSSTAIVLQTLAEKRLLDTRGGRSAFSVLLMQDVAVIPILAFLPLLGTIPAEVAQEDTLSLLGALPAWARPLLTLAAVAAVILTGHFLTRPLFRWIGHAHLREIDTALALFVVVSTTVLMEMVGLSPALGTFLAGVVLAGSEFRHELETDLQPFKGLLLGLFFIGIGAGLDTALLLESPGSLVLVMAAVIAGKAAVLLTLTWLSRLRGRDRWIFALALAQGGEFGFVLVPYALSLGVLGTDLAQILVLVIALSMLATPLLFLALERILLARDQRDAPASEAVDRHAAVIIAGTGRFGRNVNRLLRSAGQEAVLLDADMKAVEAMRQRGHSVFLGDPTRPEVLAAAGVADAQVLVVALDDPEAATRLVRMARRRQPHLHIIARAQNSHHAHALVRAGADEVLREVFDSALRAGRYVLEALGLGAQQAAEVEHAFARHDRTAIQELADLWQPDLPPEENHAYATRARELDEELEAAVTERLSPEGQTSSEMAKPEPHSASQAP
ncbi:potassium transporter [Rubellimicrobium rubrum]|uniref:Potassium transporter n=1 Tax=Rubellimicrobium rubrum TaxID=2585369 RepID=A0A5C4N3Q7_9RHOB|nr:cation:proton antiporter [Rubellimicrobium rubrum]TNC51625.1 potassium transporter [Rubellimicrobium rubrum]